MINKTHKMGTLIHGIASTSHLDSAGERIQIEGVDISRLTEEGTLNYEHKSDQPSSIVGKILKAKKIFKESDCDDEHQRKFWNRIKTPYIYIVGELFDAVGHSSAADVAAMLRYDELRKPREEGSKNLINFSIEGSRIEKQGAVITKCIAKKVSITITPANKACVAEEYIAPISKEIRHGDGNVVSVKKAEYHDQLPGGLADKKKPSDFPKKKLMQGVAVEMEHTKDANIAREIAMDHLSEDINYYSKLKQIEKTEIVCEILKAEDFKQKAPAMAVPMQTTAKINTPAKETMHIKTGMAVRWNKPKMPKTGAQTYGHPQKLKKTNKYESNFRKAITASCGMGAPSAKVNDLDKAAYCAETKSEDKKK